MGEETSHSFETQSSECKSRKEEYDSKDQLRGPEDLRRCSPEKEKVAKGMHFSFCVSCQMDSCMADFALRYCGALRIIIKKNDCFLFKGN